MSLTSLKRLAAGMGVAMLLAFAGCASERELTGISGVRAEQAGVEVCPL